MDFSISEEQQLLRDTLRRCLEREYAFEARKKICETTQAHSPAVWSTLTDMGLMALAFGEADGGLGGGGTEVSLVAAEFGRALVVEPYMASTIMAGTVIEAIEDADKRQAHVAAIAAGTPYALCHAEAQARYELASVETLARPASGGYVVNGDKTTVLGGGVASCLLVSARVDDGVAVFAVDAEREGVARRCYRTNDGQGAAEISFTDVKVEADDMVLGPRDGLAAIQFAAERANIFLVSEAAAIMRWMCDATREYIATRQQFGTALAKFQVLQHRLVDMNIEAEQSYSMAVLAADAWDSGADERARVVAAAKAFVGRSARFVGQNAIQLHGGIGMAIETPVSHYFKRLAMIELQLGNTTHHLRRFASRYQGTAGQLAG